jgi:hypothetical protein
VSSNLEERPANLGRWDRAGYAAAMLGFALAAVTGFGGWLRSEELRGWLLLIHMLAAPLFIAGLTLLAVTRADRCRFGPSGGPVASGQKLAFWAAITLGLASTGTMLMAMLPVFGYAGQETLTEIHRYCGLGLAGAVVLHLALLAAGSGQRK